MIKKYRHSKKEGAKVEEELKQFLSNLKKV